MGSLGWIAILVSVFAGLIARLLATEISVWHEPLCKFLVRQAVRRLPETKQKETLSDWLDIIEQIPSPTAQLINALSYYLSAGLTRQAMEPQARMHQKSVWSMRNVFRSLVNHLSLAGLEKEIKEKIKTTTDRKKLEKLQDQLDEIRSIREDLIFGPADIPEIDEDSA